MSLPRVEPPVSLRSSEATVGPLMVRRALPVRARRTVGAWCFVDHLGPATLTRDVRADIAPHPHFGLQTVTWLFSGAFVHRDSLGSEQIIRPGQLNLMSAGRGVAHSEEDPGHLDGTLHGVQLWLVQPDATRWSGPSFEHHSDVPLHESSTCEARVVVGELLGVTSRARHDADVVGAELRVRRGATIIPARRDFEYVVVGVSGSADVMTVPISPGSSVYVGPGRDEIVMSAEAEATVMLLGGVPLATSPVMWWNFVARSREEIVEAWRSWSERDGRFGEVVSSLAPVDTPPPAWLPRECHGEAS